jgi:hypothetical protein
VKLLLRPHVNDLPRILLAEPLLEPVVVPDILLARLKLVEGRLEDLDRALLGNIQRCLRSHIGSGSALGMHDDGLLARGDDPVDGIQHAAVHQLEEQDAGLRVDGLVRDGSLFFILNAMLAFSLFDGEVSNLVVHFVRQLNNGCIGTLTNIKQNDLYSRFL